LYNSGAQNPARGPNLACNESPSGLQSPTGKFKWNSLPSCEITITLMQWCYRCHLQLLYAMSVEGVGGGCIMVSFGQGFHMPLSCQSSLRSACTLVLPTWAYNIAAWWPERQKQMIM